MLAVGARSDSYGLGAAWIFVYDASSVSYRQLGSKLVGLGYANNFVEQGMCNCMHGICFFMHTDRVPSITTNSPSCIY